MNRPITTLFAALEALLAVGIGIGVSLVPLTFMWAFQYGLQVDWTVFWRASVDIWLLGHGADVLLTLDPVTAAAVGFPDAGTPFVVSIAALGFALLTVLLGARAGRRLTETPFVRWGMIVAVLAFAGLAVAVTVSAVHRFARPSMWQGALLPTLFFTFGLLLGAWLTARRLERMPGRTVKRGRLRTWWHAQPSVQRTVLSESLRGGVAASALVVAAAGLITAGMIFGHYAQIIALYEGIHTGVLGGVAVTLAQFAFLPNLIVWAGSWLIGPGFAIGTGSSVGPLGTSLGPLPAVPVFGALPTGDFAFGFAGLLVPIVAGFLVGVFVRPAVLRLGARNPVAPLVLTGVGMGLVGGLVFGVLAWVSGGAAGPGRLAEVGPDALQVGLLAAIEFGLPAILGLLAGRAPRGK